MEILSGWADAGRWGRREDGQIVAIGQDKSYKEVLRNGLTIDELVSVMHFSNTPDILPAASKAPETETNTWLSGGVLDFAYELACEDRLYANKESKRKSKPAKKTDKKRHKVLPIHTAVRLSLPPESALIELCSHCGSESCDCDEIIRSYGSLYCESCGHDYRKLHGDTSISWGVPKLEYLEHLGMYVKAPCEDCNKEFVKLRAAWITCDRIDWEVAEEMKHERRRYDW